MIAVAVLESIVAATPPTVTDDAFVRKVPLRVTEVPRNALTGNTPLSVGASNTVNVVEAVPPGALTTTGTDPDPAP